MSKELKKGCVVFMKASSGLVGYGNAQCVSEVHHESLGTISLYGHNQHYKTYDIDKIVEYPDEQLQAENTDLKEALQGLMFLEESMPDYDDAGDSPFEIARKLLEK